MHVANNTMPVRYDKFCTILLYCYNQGAFLHTAYYNC